MAKVLQLAGFQLAIWMDTLEILFWVSLATIIYTHAGYGLLMYLLAQTKRRLIGSAGDRSVYSDDEWPAITFIIAAYNEEDFIQRKIDNCLALDYPIEKIQFWFVTDGSSDRTEQIVRQAATAQPGLIRCFHSPERKGKIAAVDRIMPLVSTPVTIFSDANTILNREAVKRIVRHYENPAVGVVAGEKRVAIDSRHGAASSEGFYWRYESLLKKWESQFHSAIGAAGELFSIRTALYRPVEPDTLIEDFVMTMRIAMRGYRIAYEPQAYALEQPSASVAEELKRKIRIAAGDHQAVQRLRALLNPFRYGWLAFQYFSHRVLRWVVAPLMLPVLFFSNMFLATSEGGFYAVFFSAQCLFYLLALAGYFLQKKNIRNPVFFLPYYFCMMNYAMYAGFFRLLRGRQQVTWEKAKRAM